MLRLRGRCRAMLAVALLAALGLVYTLVDLTAITDSHHNRHARKLQIVRISAQDIAKVAGSVGPGPGLPNILPPNSHHAPSLSSTRHILPSTVIPDTELPHQVPFLKRVSGGRLDTIRLGNLHYDESDTVISVSTHTDTNNATPTTTISTEVIKKDTVDSNKLKDSPKFSVEINEKVLNDDIAKHGVDIKTNRIITKENELISLSNLKSIPKDKRKVLEMYLSHLSEAQFNEVFESVVGYNNQPFDLADLDKYKKDELPKVAASYSRSLSEFPLNRTSNANPPQEHRPCINGCVAHKHFASSPNKGYASRVVVESITLPPDWSASPAMTERLQHRKDHVKQVCQKNGLDNPANSSINAWEFLINPAHHLVWCSVFKAASSTWFYNFNVLAGYTEQFLLKAKETPITLARRKYPRPSEPELHRFMNQTVKPLSFMIVRHPLQRLVSGYRDKLLSGRRYYSNLAQKIVMSYPHLGSKSMIDRAVLNPNDPRNNPNSLINSIVKSSKAVARIVVPTFPQFVQFIIDSEKKGEMLDEHWTPINKFCTPCLFDFDVIAKMETLDEDNNYVIFKSGIEDIIKPKRINRNRSAPTDKVADSFLCQLSRRMMIDLVNMYKYDLELFEYDYSHYINCTTDTVRLGKASL